MGLDLERLTGGVIGASSALLGFLHLDLLLAGLIVAELKAVFGHTKTSRLPGFLRDPFPAGSQGQYEVARCGKVLHSGFVGVVDQDLVTKLGRALAGRAEILDAYLFGSQARGTVQGHSDVDVAVYVERATDLNRGFGIDAEIAADLMSVLGRNDVDVVLLNLADPVLYHRVLRDGVRLVVRDPKATAGREGYALSRYFDFLPQLEKIRLATEGRADGERHTP
jgi:predicted nucleotidyltransferase